MNVLKGTKEFFPSVEEIKFEGKASANRWHLGIMKQTEQLWGNL